MFVCVLNKNKKPLDMCSPAKARKLLKQGKAIVHKRYPFVIRLKECKPMEQPNGMYELRYDPGSKVTGVATTKNNKVMMLGEIHHKQGIKDSLESRNSLRRGRRNRKTRYRRCKYPNKLGQKSEFTSSRPKGWLAPSLLARVQSIENFTIKMQKYVPISHIYMELVKFDTQKMQNPEISGVEYQQGELQGYEVREYLLEKFNRKCAYCHATDISLEVEHYIPKSRGGSDRVSNLTLACRSCNEDKGNFLPEEWITKLSKSKKKMDKIRLENFKKIKTQLKKPLKDASAVNSTRWKVYETLKNTKLPIDVQSGAKTKMQRIQNKLPKEHYYDALSVGEQQKWVFKTNLVVEFHTVGRGNRQMARVDKYGFPLQHLDKEKHTKDGKRKGHKERKKSCQGFQTGDIVKATISKGKKKGIYFGRLMIRHNGYFDIKNFSDGKTVQGISYKDCKVLQRNDGWSYQNKSRTVSSLD